MNFKEISRQILNNIGGPENILDITHCFTRIRLVLKDTNKVNKKALESIESIITVVEAGGQLQIVIGDKVTKVYESLLPLVKLENTKTSISNSSKFNYILQTISKMFTPMIPAIAASGLIKGLLTAIKMLLANKGIDISTNDTYLILYNTSQVIFYFMPIFLAYTAAKSVKVNEFTSMVLGGLLCYPAMDALIQDVSVKTTIFGLPVIKSAWSIGDATRVFSYTESVIPIILSVLTLIFIERTLKKVIPQVLQIILVPGLSLIIMVPITLVIVGPIGIYVGYAIQYAYNSLISISSTLGGALIGGLWGVFVIFGGHRALLPIGLNDVAVTGKQNILAYAGAANFSQGGAALGVMLKTKNKELKGIAASAVISAALVGITEPAIYGCNLRFKKPLVCAIAAGALGGAIMGFGGVYGDAFANNGVLTIFTYSAFGLTKFIYYIAGCLVSFFGAAILTYIFGYKDEDPNMKGV